MCKQRRCKQDQDPGDEVRRDDLEGLLKFVKASFLDLHVRDLIDDDVVPRRINGKDVRINADDLPVSELPCGNGKDAGTGPEVEKALGRSLAHSSP